MAYTTPARDMQFVLNHMTDFAAIKESGAFPDLSDELVEAVLQEIGKLADNVIAPLNRKSDTDGARLENGQVFTTPGFPEAYQQFVEGGWSALAFPEDWGGQGLPQTLALAVSDAIFAACLGFSMGTTLTTGAVKALLAYGSDEQKRLYLPKMVTGEWTGTMNLTEPHAGSDLSNLKTRAVPTGDGRYRISGTKIYISYGDHDLTENICHLVLARLPDAPEGTRGISMFLVPKFHVNEDGSLGSRNDVKCVGLEEKMGQHGSPTCVMAYGENDECYGTIVGNEHEGMKNMFVMMNAARIDVGLQGAAMCERALQQAVEFAQERRQGREYGVKSGDAVVIYQHPDVRRNLYTMKALTDASRAVCYAAMVAHDLGKHEPDEAKRQAAKEREELLTPIAKSWATDRANEVTSIGVQVHGGMGFVEETGAEQHMRDVRISAIYEGTNGIQAIDLVGRKLGMGGGKLARDFIAECRAQAEELAGCESDDLKAISTRLGAAAAVLEETTEWMIAAMARGADEALAGATPYQDLFGYVAGGLYLSRGAAAADRLATADAAQAAYYQSKVQVARFYADNILPRVNGLAPAVMAGADTVAPLDPALLSG